VAWPSRRNGYPAIAPAAGLLYVDASAHREARPLRDPRGRSNCFYRDVLGAELVERGVARARTGSGPSSSTARATCRSTRQTPRGLTQDVCFWANAAARRRVRSLLLRGTRPLESAAAGRLRSASAHEAEQAPLRLGARCRYRLTEHRPRSPGATASRCWPRPTSATSGGCKSPAPTTTLLVLVQLSSLHRGHRHSRIGR
jgi:hypothetical protein